MHMGTNIVLIITCFGFVGMGLGAVRFWSETATCIRLSLVCLFLGTEAKIGTAVIPRHLFEYFAGSSFYTFPQMVSGSPEVRFNFLVG